MDYKVYFRRVVAVLLCCVLAFHSSLPVARASDPVTAATLAITGGQLASGALAGEAGIAALAGPVGAVVGVTLGALGINAYVSKAAQDAGKTRTRFVLDKLVTWGVKAGYTKEQLYKKIAQGISVAADGTIQLGKDAAKIIEQFGSWLFTQENTVVPSISESGSVSATFGNITYNAFTSGGWTDATGYTYIWQATAPCFVLHSGRDIDFITLETGKVVLYGHETADRTLTLSYERTSPAGQKFYNGGITNSEFRGATVEPLSASMDAKTFVASLGGVGAFETTPAADEVFTGTPESWVENKDVLNPSADTPIVLNPDLLNAIINSLTEGQQATMSVIDYLKALEDTWDDALDDVKTSLVSITDTLTGIQEQISVSEEAVKNPTITNPSVVPETIPILNPSVVDPDIVVPGFSFPLDEIFPFCIPFDVVAAIKLFDVPPEAPTLHVHWELPYNIVFDFDLDLSQYDDVAALLRTMETILFAVGLAVATRSLYIRS